MAKSKYKEKILEKMKLLNEQIKLLSDILKECMMEEKIVDGDTSTNNG